MNRLEKRTGTCSMISFSSFRFGVPHRALPLAARNASSTVHSVPRMRTLAQIVLGLIALFIAISPSLGSQNKICTATGDLEIIPFESKVFPAARSLRVLLPPGYHAATNHGRKYPVLYLNDGQNLFDVCTSMYTKYEWRVDETVNELTARGEIPPMIVVGIDNGGRRLRPKEYLPYVDETLSPPEPDPQGKLYPQFLLNEIVPFIEGRYRVLPGSSHRALGGSSYGAGIAFYTIISRPGSFGGLLLESPSVYADNYHLLRDAESVHIWPQRVYIGTSTANDEPVEDVSKLKALFQKAALSDDRLRVVFQDGGTHSEQWWAQRLPSAIRFLFPTANTPTGHR